MSSLHEILPSPTDGNVLPTDDDNNSTTQPSESIRILPASQPEDAAVSRVVSLPVTSQGTADFTAIVRQGENAHRTIHATRDSLVEKSRSQALQPLPSQSELDETTRRTRAALEKASAHKIVTTTRGAAKKEKPTFLKYTPANTNISHSSGSTQRIIKMVNNQVDPMAPPRFSQKKAPVNPPSPPVPVLHSPDRKLSKEEAANWKIPPVVSNWKNNRGYTIALDKRLAADGRQTIERGINDRFAEFAKVLEKAEQNAREEVAERGRLQRQVEIKKKERREREVHELAEKARRERKGWLGGGGTDVESSVAPEDVQSILGARAIVDEPPPGMNKPRRRSRFSATPSTATAVENEEERDDVRRRETVRQERRIQRERGLRMEAIESRDVEGPTLKRTKLTRDVDRDLSERIALGQGAVKGSGDVLFDQRLFNQDAGGGHGQGHLGQGFGAEDGYNVYDGPLFEERTKSLFRVGTSGRREREATQAAKAADNHAGRREETVEFEKD